MRIRKSTGRASRRPSVLALAFAGLFGLSFPGAIGAEVTPAEREAYRRAMAASSKPSQQMISARLLALVKEPDPVNVALLKGGAIRWSADGTRVLVSSVLARADWEKYYAPCLGKESCPLAKSLWVTVVPELKTRFVPWERWSTGWVRTYDEPCPPTQRRVIQLLGLNPAAAYDVLVEMWVEPKDLFRPSGDPETRGHGAELVTTEGGKLVFPADRSLFTKLDDTVMMKDAAWSKPATGAPFRTWFANLAATSYFVDDPDMTKWGSPWTQLGYTYDWGNEAFPFGASEFILRIDPCKGAADPSKACDGGLLDIQVERGVDLAVDRDRAGYFSCDPTW